MVNGQSSIVSKKRKLCASFVIKPRKATPPTAGYWKTKLAKCRDRSSANIAAVKHETPFKELKILAPCEPSKIVCVGRNYVDHAKELGNEVPKIPLIFLKPPSSIIATGEHIILPSQSKQVEHEGELVVVMGKRARNVTAESAKEFIFGYTIGNDVTARDLQKSDEQWTRAKGFDTFCSFGPWIDTDFDPSDAVVTCRVNGQMRQMASSRDMVFNVGTLIAYISSVMTLEPGDLIFTGTPAGVGELRETAMWSMWRLKVLEN
jgi:2-keto-4-pentenoate hydratase/2-oxohepta-3-ene-1,7-dioic acid hydratase in catechol pathway